MILASFPVSTLLNQLVKLRRWFVTVDIIVFDKWVFYLAEKLWLVFWLEPVLDRFASLPLLNLYLKFLSICLLNVTLLVKAKIATEP